MERYTTVVSHLCLGLQFVCVMPKDKSSTTTLRRERDKAACLKEMALNSYHRSVLRQSTLVKHMRQAEMLWNVAPATQLQRISYIADPHVRTQLRDHFENLHTFSMFDTSDTSNFETAEPTYKGFSFIQLSCVYVTLYHFLGNLRNPFIASTPPPTGPGQATHILLDAEEILSCVCKLNFMASAFFEGARWSPFQLICRLATRSGVKFVPRYKNDFSLEDPQTWVMCCGNWGRLQPSSFWETILYTKSSCVNFANLALGLKISWSVGKAVMRGAIESLLEILAKSRFLDSTSEAPAHPLIDDLRDKAFLPLM